MSAEERHQRFDEERGTPRGLPQTADRALLILLGIDGREDGWGVTEVAQEFGLHTSVAQRLLAVLAHRGFLIVDPSTHRYRIGPSAMHLGRTWQRSESLRTVVDPVLRDVAVTSGASAILAVPDSFHMRSVAAVDGARGPLRYYPLVGELYPAHAGATCKAYYAYLPAAQRHRIFADRPMARFTERTVVDPELLDDQFREIRARGYAFTVGEYDRQVATLAVLVTVGSEPFGSLSLGAPDEEFGDPLQHVPLLHAAARSIELRLTGRRT